MKTTTTKVLASILIVAATLAAIALSYKGHAAELEPRKFTQENSPAADWKVTQDKPPAGATALSIERDGDTVLTITVYGRDGKPTIIVHPDGTVDILRGTPDEASRLFWETVARYVGDCSKR